MPAQSKHQSEEPPSARALTPAASLRQATAAAHQSVENASSWEDIFASVDSYATFLRRLFPLIAGAEMAVEPYLVDAGSWAQERRRAAWIEEDLHFLVSDRGHDVSETGECPPCAAHDFGWVTSDAQAAGICYVLEGSALGGVYLARQVQQTLGLDSAGARYLAGNGAKTGALWKQVTEWLNRVLLDPKALRQAKEAADAMFAEYELVVRSVTKVN